MRIAIMMVLMAIPVGVMAERPPYVIQGEAVPEQYVVCGCGCCGGVEPEEIRECVPEERLRAMIRADREAANAPSCQMAGCAMGQRYTRCR